MITNRVFRSDKLLKYLDRVQGDRRPITADVFITNFCNNRCPYCTYKRWGFESDAKWMSYDEFVRYAIKLVSLGVQGIILTGGGEPMLNQDFYRITKWLDEGGVPYGINTNFNVLKECKPDYLKVSLDAWDEDSYELARGVREYERTRLNIKRFVSWRDENSPKTKVGIQLVATSAEQVRNFYKANKDLPVDYIVIRPIESTAGSYYKREPEREMAMLIRFAIQELQGDSRVNANYKWDMLCRKYDRCTAHWAQIAVNERGEVMYCCHKPYEIIGHLLDEDILAKYEAARTDMSMCDIPCRLTGPNGFMEQVETDVANREFI